MKFRHAVFIVAYAKVKEKIYYLLLKRKLHWEGWEFPKGAVEKNENLIKAVKRELKEETGLNAKKGKIKKFNFKGKYLYDKEYADRKGFKGQTFQLFSVEVKKEKIKVDKREHSKGRWFEFKDAVKKLKWNNQKRSLEIVKERLEL